MAKRRVEVIDDFDGRNEDGTIRTARRVHLVGGSPITEEPVPMASLDDKGVLRDPAGKPLARDPELVRYDRASQTRVSYVERDSGPASAQAYRPVIEENGTDDAGRAAKHQRRATGIEYLYRAGDVTEAQIQAVRWLADRIETAQLGAAIQAVDWLKTSTGFDPSKAFGPTGGDLSVSARQDVREALRALDWPDSLSARLLIYTIATGNGVIGWLAEPTPDPAKRKHRQYLVGCLTAGVVQLEIWYRARG